MDLIVEKLKRRFDQDGIKTAALREQVDISAAKNNERGLSASSPSFDRNWLAMQLKMLGDVLGNSPDNTIQDIAARFLSPIHKQKLFSKKLKI